MLPLDSFPPDTPTPSGPHDALLALRARAEKRRYLVTQATEHHSAEETQRLVQELQVHQIELEMQYEELLLAQAEAQAARAEYLDLFDFAPVAYFTLSPVGAIMQLNLCGAKNLGTVRQRLVGRRFALFVVPASRLEFGQFLARVLSTDTSQSIDLMLQREDGATFHGHLEGMHVATPGGSQCRLAVLDTTARQRAVEALAASEARFRTLFAESSDAVVLMQGHQFVDCNTAALHLLGASSRQQVVGRVAWSYAPELQPDGRRTVDLFRETVVEALRRGSMRCEALMHKITGEAFWVEAVLTPMELSGQMPLVHILWRDITAMRAATEELRREKEFSENLLENSVDGIVALDSDRRITAWNAEAARYFGQEAANVLGRPIAEALPTLDTKSEEAISQALAGQRTSCLARPFQNRPGHYDAYLVPLKNGAQAQPSGVLIIIRDVTERDRLAEEAVQQRLRQQQEVLAAILTTQESERKRIAEAIHNGLGQLLYATKLSLEGPRDTPIAPPETLKLLNEAIRTTRTISFELTPGILEDFGLRTALEELMKRVTRARLPVRLHLANLDERLPPQVEITVYRVVQELLNNVMKHAQATEVEVHVAHEDHRIEVSVEDNGRGFDPAALAKQPLAGIGLPGVRNRVVLLGGELAIKSRLGQGTIVSFELSI